MVMQEVLIKVIRSAQHFVDIPNHKFDEMLIFLDGIFDHLRAQAPTSSAYDSLSKQINIIFQRVFERLVELKLDSSIRSKAISCKRGRDEDNTMEISLGICTPR